jgi:hypothetical protein
MHSLQRGTLCRDTNPVDRFNHREVWGSHTGDYEECCLLGCDIVMSSGSLPTFQINVLPLFSGWKSETSGQASTNLIFNVTLKRQ